MSSLRQQLQDLGRFGSFCGAVIWRMFTPPYPVGATARYVVDLVFRCLLPVWAVVFPTGMVLALQGLSVFQMFGAERMLPGLVGVAVLRELAPVLASVLVAAQGGSSFAAEVGSMRIQEQLDATEVMAVDSLRVHVVPRVTAALIATPLLQLTGAFGGILGGWLVAVIFKGENNGIYWGNLWTLTARVDLYGGTLKALVFGLVIGLVSTYKGFTAHGGAAGVGRAVNDTVVVTVTTFIVANYFLTSALYGG